jgi:adenylate cyclase
VCDTREIGSRGRFESTAIGSVVNLAARLCERATNGEVIIDSSVKSLLPDHVKTQALGQFKPNGFKRPIDIFNVLAGEENAA